MNPRPNSLKKFCLGNDPSPMTEKLAQDEERLHLDRARLAVHRQAPGVLVEFGGAELPTSSGALNSWIWLQGFEPPTERRTHPAFAR